MAKRRSKRNASASQESSVKRTRRTRKSAAQEEQNAEDDIVLSVTRCEEDVDSEIIDVNVNNNLDHQPDDATIEENGIASNLDDVILETEEDIVEEDSDEDGKLLENQPDDEEALEDADLVEESEDIEEFVDNDDIVEEIENIDPEENYVEEETILEEEEDSYNNPEIFEDSNDREESRTPEDIYPHENEMHEEYGVDVGEEGELELDPNEEQEMRNDEFDTRSEASSDRNGEDGEIYENGNHTSSRAISPIVFDRDSSSSEEDVENDESIYPPGEADVVMPKKEIVLPPIEVRTERRERHTKMLKYLFREAHFYMIKSNNHENVSLAKAKSVWSTPPSNEAKINRSFQEARNVILVFSVRESGAFQGFARVATSARHDLAAVNWVLPAGLSARALGGVFELDWLCRRELSFAKTGDIYNPFNGSKPVKIGRDGQEVEPNAGKMLCLEFPHDDKLDLEGIINRIRKQHKSEGGPPKYKPPQPVEEFSRRSRGRGRRPEPYKNTADRGRDRSNRQNFPPPSYRSNRSDRPRASNPGKDYYSRRENNHVQNGHYSTQSHNQHPVYNSIPPAPLYAVDSYSNSYSSYQPSFSDPYHSQHSASKYSDYNPSSSRVSSSVSRSSRSNHDRYDNSVSSRIYDSRSHAAACDDFVRRVAGGKSAVSSSVSTKKDYRDSRRTDSSSYPRESRSHRSSGRLSEKSIRKGSRR